MQMRLLACAVCVLSLALLGGCEERLTEANYDRIQAGMPYQEVESLLGAGKREDVSGAEIGSGGVLSGSGTGPTRTYSWTEGNKQVIIEVRDDKVLTKRKMGF
jgi:hypothetical protein